VGDEGGDVGSLGLAEVAVVAVVALLVFGPERLPELARQAGKALAKFRTEAGRSVDELKRAADLGDLEAELRGIGSDARALRDDVTRRLTTTAGPRPDDAPPPTDPDTT
jgi:sec-independent protein translocase protein TatB